VRPKGCITTTLSLPVVSLTSLITFSPCAFSILLRYTEGTDTSRNPLLLISISNACAKLHF
jgi:hypothetical protein